MSEIPKKLEELISGIRIACNKLEFEGHFWLVLAIRESFILNLYGYNRNFFNKLILISKKGNTDEEILRKFEELNNRCFSAPNSIYIEDILNKGLPAISDILPPLNKSLIILKNSSNEKWKEIIEFFDYRIVIENLPKLKQIENINFNSVMNCAQKFEDCFRETMNGISTEYIRTFSDKFKEESILDSLKYIFTMYLYHLAMGYDILIYYPLKITDDSEIVPVSIFKYDNFVNPKQFLIFFWKYIKVLSFCVHSQFYSTYLQEVIKQNKESGVTAILTESYAHNIGAHGLEGLKVYLGKQWENLKRELGLKEDKDKDEFINSVLVALKTKDINLVKNIIKTHSNFTEYLWYLQGKSAFWSAVARGGALFGGKIINMLQLINEFARNNLLCGSLGASEGFRGIEFYIKFNNGNAVKLYESTIETFKEENDESNLETKLENIQIFMPEGVVGQQSVYTIWENIVRNVKHCKKDSKELIPFYIEIKNDESKEYIEITCWLDLSSQKEDELSSKVNEMNNWFGILDENQKPNMGGTSQNILCAGMSFGLDYFKTEELQKINDKKVMKFECDNNRVKYNFKIWKGKDVGRYQDIANKTIEEIGPLGRFKIIQLKNEDEKNALLKNPFFLRHMVWEKDESGGENIFLILYQNWIKEWFELNQKKINIKIQEKKGYFENLDRQLNNSDSYTYYFYHRTPDNEIQSKSKIVIAYKNDDVIGKIIEKIRTFPIVIEENQIEENQEKESISELLEILETSIEIFDKRLNELASRIESNPSLQKLKVQVFPEEEYKIPEDATEKIHFGIFHLSFIELITGKKNDKAIAEFLKKYPHLNNRYKIIIITTGRGRGWWNGLDEGLKMKIKFMPIENLENCFDKTLAPKTPSIGVKYALVKTIFGS
jgi:hypothetical protein